MKNLKHWFLLCVCLNHLLVYSASTTGVGAPVSVGAADVSLDWGNATDSDKALFLRMNNAIFATVVDDLGHDVDTDDIDEFEAIKAEVNNPVKLAQIINMINPWFDADSLLIRAVERGKANAVRWLINNGANFLHKDSRNNTVLHIAVSNGHIEIVEFLLSLVPAEFIIAVNDDGLSLLDEIELSRNEIIEYVDEIVHENRERQLVRYQQLIDLLKPVFTRYNSPERWAWMTAATQSDRDRRAGIGIKSDDSESSAPATSRQRTGL